MKSIVTEAAKNWCSQVGLRLTRDGILTYPRPSKHRFFVLAPEEFREILPFTRTMLTFRGEAYFGGGLLWLRRWDIGIPQFIRAGWHLIEGIRRANGELQSLEVAPAQLFRDDEFVDLHAFLLQVVGFGWVAEFVPSRGGFLIHFKDNRQVCISTASAELLNELRVHFNQWNPTDEDPMVKELRELNKTPGRRTTH